jgi:hypothetical protein
MMTGIRALALGLAGLMLFSVGPVEAKKSKNQAEAERLIGDMELKAKKPNWKAVDASYGRLTKLRRVKISAKAHMLGAYAARDLSDIDDMRKRLKAAGKEGSKELSVINRSFAKVKIKKSKGGKLSPEGGMPFAKLDRTLVETAAKAVKAKGKFKGWLPVGKYTLKRRSGTSTFTARAGKTNRVK